MVLPLGLQITEYAFSDVIAVIKARLKHFRVSITCCKQCHLVHKSSNQMPDIQIEPIDPKARPSGSGPAGDATGYDSNNTDNARTDGFQHGMFQAMNSMQPFLK